MNDDRDDPPRYAMPILPDEWIAQHDFVEAAREGQASRTAAIYARRSTLDAHDASIERQVTVCADYAKKLGYEFDPSKHLYIDRNRSGSTVVGRTGLKALLMDARSCHFGKLIVESVDRLSRDLADLCQTHRLLLHQGIELHSAFYGELTLPQIVMFGLQAQTDREGFMERSRSGKRQAALAGNFIGPWEYYGYERMEDRRGLRLKADEAAVIRTAARLIDAGVSRNAVAKQFNAEGIPSPRGRSWTGRSFFRSAAETPGLLQRTILKGLFVWGRVDPAAPTEEVIDPATPFEERIEIAVPELAIIDEAVFDRINSEQDARSVPALPRSDGQRLLSGNIRCCCGAPMIANASKSWHRGSYRCDNHARRGICDAGSMTAIVELDRRVLQILRDDVLAPAHTDMWEEVRERQLQVFQTDRASERLRLTARLDILEAELEADESSDHTDDPKSFAIRAGWELEYHKICRRLEAIEEPAQTAALNSSEAAALRASISELLLRLPCVAFDPEDLDVVQRLRELLPRIVVHRNADRGLTLRCLIGVPGYPPGSLCELDVIDERWIERSFPPPRKGRIKHTEAVLAHHDKAEDDSLSLSDGEWDAVEHLFQPFTLTRAGSRGYADAMIYIASTGMPNKLLPERHRVSRIDVKKVRELDLWPRLIEILEAIGSPLSKNLNRSRFSRLADGERTWYPGRPSQKVAGERRRNPGAGDATVG